MGLFNGRGLSIFDSVDLPFLPYRAPLPASISSHAARAVGSQPSTSLQVAGPKPRYAGVSVVFVPLGPISSPYFGRAS